ncbi:MAG TPA: immunoglobulin domain-containing protein, partial [Verrucomicrobiae bacterium]|nr:immunoglobulin domain-containing protein [Verrucomicrobiae bacterium]
MPLRSEATVSEPQILSQPESQTVSSGSNVTFSVTVSGDNLSYQWWFNGHALSDGTNASYSLMNVEAGDTGDYQ